MVILFSVLKFLFVLSLFHVVPNIIMKLIKSTDYGHKILSGLFSAGVELGRKGRVLNKAVKQFIKYGIGPEALVEYELGLEMGHTLSVLDEKHQEIYLQLFKDEILEAYEGLSEEGKRRVMNTPFTSTGIAYARGEVNSFVERAVSKYSQKEDRNSFKGYAINALLLTIAALVQPHILFQPVVCFIRDRVGRSKFGKKFMQDRFTQGYEGRVAGTLERLFYDYAVSPSALDTMRLGYTVGKALE